MTDDTTERDSDTRKRGQLQQRAAGYVQELYESADEKGGRGAVGSLTYKTRARMVEDFGEPDADAAIENELRRREAVSVAAQAVEEIDPDELERHAATITDRTAELLAAAYAVRDWHNARKPHQISQDDKTRAIFDRLDRALTPVQRCGETLPLAEGMKQ